MTKRALVIRTAGDASLAGAIVDGMRMTMKVDPEVERKVALYDVSRKRDAKSWERKITKARRTYRFREYTGFPARVLGLWACVCMTIYKMLGGDID